METTTAGQNPAQAVQNGFDRRLISQGAGRIEQISISIFGARHVAMQAKLGLLYQTTHPLKKTVLSVRSMKAM